MVRSAFLFVIIIAVAGVAQAQPPSKCDVLLVSHAEAMADAFAPRLLAELAAAKLTTRTRLPSSGPLDALGREDGCLAVVRALPSGKGVELWLDDAANGRPLVRNLVLDERPMGPDVTMVVLQTTELLRAGLQGHQTQTPPKIETSQPTVVAFAPTRRHTLSLGAGAGVVRQRGGFASVPALRLEAAWQPWPDLGPELAMQAPWQSAALQTVEGRTQATPWSAALGARVSHTSHRWFAELGLGFLWQVWHVKGFPQAALSATSHTFFALGVYTRARAGVNVLPWLRCGVELGGSANASETRVVHAERDVGAVGRLGVSSFFTVEALAL